jgi:hypothetical protein
MLQVLESKMPPQLFLFFYSLNVPLRIRWKQHNANAAQAIAALRAPLWATRKGVGWPLWRKR